MDSGGSDAAEKLHAAFFGQMFVFDVQLHQRLDMLLREGEGVDDDRNIVAASPFNLAGR